MKPIHLLPIILTLLVCLSNASASQNKVSLNRCESQGHKIEISVTTNQKGYRISQPYTSKTLNTKSRSSLAGDYVVGLTSLESTTKIDVSGPVWQDKSKEGECFAAQIKVQLSYEPIQVYIGNEFLEGSCAYSAILEHELQHVRLYQQNLPEMGKIVKDLMEKRFSGKPVYAERGSSKHLLEKEIDEFWRPLIKAEFAKFQIQQAELDSEENISKVTWSCLGEIQNKFGFRYN
ncbi:hypothetical protein [Undibacterium fentianense]|uniref:DUF4157 domain-containing protein n=1 Tax=Undibacterium fentianense TaxID=2828728 RepID=A0A941IF33_9BURK|nr:hypothetical protein [Undibacterium fentianense]MBR7800296.1 hypothetical protein [Undibacterium fentianense]